MLARFIAGACILLTAFLLTPIPAYSQAPNPNPPPTPVRLVFIHHSTGEYWLNPNPEFELGGALLTALNNNNYFVSDTNYYWGPVDPIWGEHLGSRTDIGDWHNWFLGPQRDANMVSLYTQTGFFTDWEWTNSIDNPDPGGENQIIMFKSCFPNSAVLSGNPADPPRQSSSGNPNPIWGRSTGEVTEENQLYSVSNVKGMYRDLLAYFANHQDKLFILITPPPNIAGSADLARAVNIWLVYHWLDDYPYNNVAVFDFFNVLTSNGGSTTINDLSAAAGNHHRLRYGEVRYTIQASGNYSAYPSGDSHPTAAGGQKATGEFVPLLNIAYHAWKGTGGRPWYMGRGPKASPRLSLLLLN
jgi:hypothetical protein